MQIKSCLTRALIILTPWCIAGLAPAATRTWDGEGGSGNNANWGRAQNWDNDIAIANGDNLIFTGANKKVNTNNTLTSVGWVQIANGGWTIRGNGILLTGHLTNVLGDNAFNLAMTNNTDRIHHVTAGQLNMDGVIRGSGGLIKTGAGTNRLRAANLYAGNTWIKEGVIRCGIPSGSGVNRLPATTILILGDDVANTSGRFELNNRAQTVAGLTTLGGGAANSVVNFSGTMVTFTVNNTADFTYGGFLGGPNNNEDNFAFTKSGVGTLTLSGVNTYAGATTLSDGILRLGANQVIPDGSGKGNVTLNGTLDLNGFSETINGLSGAGLVDNLGGGTSTLTVGNNNGVGAFLGQIRNSAGSVAVTKVGTGIIALAGTNTYSGLTLVSGGKLVLGTVHAGTGAITVNDGTGLAVTNVALGTTLTTPSLALGTIGAGVTNEFHLGTLGNPTTPMAHVTNLVTMGTVYVNVTGFGLAEGQFTLIDYDGAIGGDGYSFVSNSLPPGVSGYLSNNLANSSVDLVITAVPSLVWRGTYDLAGTEFLNLTATDIINLAVPDIYADSIVVTDDPFTTTYTKDVDYTVVVNGAVTGIQRIDGGAIEDGQTVAVSYTAAGGINDHWDVGGRANWVDASSGNPFTFLNGLAVAFNDTALTNWITLQQSVSPFGITVSNETKDFTFSTLTGAEQIQGIGGLRKDGAARLTLAVANNSYAGDTLILRGTVQLAATEALPHGADKGNVQVAAGAVLDLAGVTETINGLSGAGTVDNSSGAGWLTVNTNGASSVFSGLLQNSGGTLTLDKRGGGTLTLTGPNTYSGGTTNSDTGKLEVGHDQALGTGPVWLRANTTFSSADTTPHTLANSFIIGGNCVLGDAVNNGVLTLSGGVDWNGGARHLTIHSDTVLGGPFGNGGLDQKLGPGTLTLRNISGQSTAGNFQIQEGLLVMDGGSLDRTTGGIRIMSLMTNGYSAFRLLNGGSITFSGTGQNVRVGSTGPDGNPTATNVLEIAGTITWTAANPNGQVQMGANSALAQAFLRAGGLLRPGSIVSQGNITEFNFDGGTLAPMASTATFLQGLTAANILDGGAVIDTEGQNITIAQGLLGAGSGTGGLTKNGAGVLVLSGTNTYNGPTVVNGGTLAVLGPHQGRGSFAVNSGALRLNSLYAGGGVFTLNDGAGLEIEPVAQGGTLNVQELVLGSDGLSGLQITVRSLQTNAPQIRATNLSLNTIVSFNLAVAGLKTGEYPLLAYSSEMENGGWINDVCTLPPGVVGHVEDDQANSVVKLVITQVPPPITWLGLGPDWDINISLNWTNPLTGQVETYLEPGGVGPVVRFDDLAQGNTSVNLAGPVSPGGVLVAGAVNNYTFSGAGRLSGGGGLVKEGGTTLTLSTSNDFTGLVEVKGGTVVAGHNSALGATNNGTVVYAGATLDTANFNLGLEPVWVSGAGVNGLGALRNGVSSTDTSADFRDVTLTGDTTFGGVGRWDLRANAPTDPGLRGNGYKLTKVGSSTVALVGPDPATGYFWETALGNLDIREGVLTFERNISMGLPNALAVVHSNATLLFYQCGITNPLVKQVALTNAQVRAGGPAGGTGTNVFSGTLELAGNCTLDVYNGSTLFLHGPIGGSGQLSKIGDGRLLLTSANSFAGGFNLTAGRVDLAHDAALGAGLVTVSAGTLTSDGLNARTIANNVLVTAAFTLGDPTNAGTLEFTGTFDFNGGARGFTVSSPVVLSGGSTNGRLNKLGASVMTLRGVHVWNGDAETRNGILIVEGIVTNTGAFRPDCDQAGGSARLVIANGGLAVYDGTGGNFRVGNDGNTTATNYLDIAGAIRTPTANTSNGRIFIGGGGTKGIATLLPGGDAEVRTVAKDGTAGYAQFNFNGGVLRAMGSTNNFIQGLDLALVQDGGAIIDTAGYDLTIAQPLLAGGTGGLTKNGLGTLTLIGANTYTGPTVVNGGALILSSTYNAGHSYAVSSGAVLRVNTVAGTPLNANAVTAADGGVLDLNIGANATPAVPVIAAGTLTANGTVIINILGQNTGANFTVGQRITLLTYTSASGLAGLQLGSLPVGVAATLDNNVANSSVDLVITGSARALKWGGELGDAWDINTTINWTNLVTTLWDVYGETAAFGDMVRFDDTATTRSVNVTTDVRPSVLVVDGALDYDFYGDGKIGGSVSLVKNGLGALTVNNVNSYTGGTLLNAGTLRLGTEGALGSGILQLAGGAALTADGIDPRTVTNEVLVAGNINLGDALFTGPLTLAGPINLGGGARTLTNHSDVVISGPSTNGVIHKLGAGTLTVRGTHVWNADSEINDGTMILDGATITKIGPVRPDCVVPGGLARLVVTNGAQLFYTNGNANLRLGQDGDPTALNIIDLAGLVRIPNATNPHAQLAFGQNGTRGIVNLFPGGDILIRRVVDDGGYSELNFHGGIVRALTNQLDFMQGLDQVLIHDGGAIFDTAGWDITILQPMLGAGSGVGGLTKNGAGVLRLNGANAFSGPTVVTEGELSGTGSLAGALRVQTNATLNPGNGIGAFTVNNGVTLEGITMMEINRTNAQNADLLTGVITLTAGGTLVVTNVGDTLQVGDTFNLFDAATFAGGFASIILPDLPTTEWKWNTNNLMVDGTLAVVPTNEPPVAATDGFVVLMNQTMDMPITSLLTNDFDPEGGAVTFISASPLSANGGTVEVVGNQVRYTPPNGYAGPDQFIYTISDPLGAVAQGAVQVWVAATPPPPLNTLAEPKLAGGAANLLFTGIPGRDYILLRALAVEGPWSPVRTNTAPAHGVIEFSDPAAPANRAFYRTKER